MQIGGIVRGGRVGPVKRVQRGVDIESDIDTGGGQLAHTVVVALCVIDRVDADCVEAELLEDGNIAIAAGLVCKRVLGFGRAAWLIIDTTDVEPLSVGKEGFGNVRTLRVVVTCSAMGLLTIALNRHCGQ